MAIDMTVANELAAQLMREITEMQASANADHGTWISALMQLTASFVVEAEPMSTQTIVRVFGLYVDRAQAVRASHRAGGPHPGAIDDTEGATV